MTAPLTCEWCGTVFDRPRARGPVPRFCKPSHRQQAFLGRKMDRIGELEAEVARLRLQLRKLGVR